MIRGEEVDRFELALGEHAGAHYTGTCAWARMAPLPVGSQLDATTGVVHMGAGRRVRRALRSGVRAVGRGRAPSRGTRCGSSWRRRAAVTSGCRS